MQRFILKNNIYQQMGHILLTQKDAESAKGGKNWEGI